MDLSVVICTRNRAKHLKEMLAKLECLQSPGITWELILVDNNSSDETLSILEDFRLKFSVPTQAIHEPKDGLSNARNTGWKASRGEIVSFTDDDCYPQEDWLLSIIKAFKESSAAYIGGRVLLFDIEDAPITIQTSTQPILFPASTHIESGHIIGANFSCRREVFMAIGGFDSRLGAGTRTHSGEDTDFLIRASLSGFEGRYEPSVVVFHHHRRRLKKDIDKLYRGYAYGRGALSMKTIIGSRAKMAHIKTWYWRLCSLMKKGNHRYIANEIGGALDFLLQEKLFGRQANGFVSLKNKSSPLNTNDSGLQARATQRNMKALFEDPLSTKNPRAETDKNQEFLEIKLTDMIPSAGDKQ